MSIVICCDNKGCGKTSEVLYNINDKEVYCTECNKTITNISSIMKNQLRLSKQTTKLKKTTDGFSVNCPGCKMSGTPVVDKKVLICKHCGTKLQVTAIFTKMFLEQATKKK